MSEFVEQGHSTVVLKLGGAALISSRLPGLLEALRDNLPRVRAVIVHGGGELTDRMLSAAGFSTKKLDGQRVTPPEQLDTIVGSLAGTANKMLVSRCFQSGIRAVGLSLADGPIAIYKPHPQLGAVGIPDAHSGRADGRLLLSGLLDSGFTPVISSIGISETGALLNVNADYAAASVASLLGCPLFLLSDVEAVLDSDSKPIGQLSMAQTQRLLEQNFVEGGMQVKLRAALLTTQLSRRTTAIASWKHPERLIAALNGEQTGTQILPQ